jgi:hypothetical protein
MAAFRRVTLDALDVEDRASFRHVALFEDLSTILTQARYEFLVPSEGGLGWDRALLLNLVYWEDSAKGGDVLTDASIPADVVMHVGWHWLARSHLAPSFEGEILGEAIASAFDLYLVGRLLGHAPESTFLESQVPQMADVAEAAGLDQEGFVALLDRVSADPDRAFEDLRQMLFEVTTELSSVSGAGDAAEILGRYDGHPFGSILHHYELATWILRGRARRYSSQAEDAGTDARALHTELKAASSSIDWLTEHWVHPRVLPPSREGSRGRARKA